MPCNIGYKNVSKIQILAPQLKKFESKTEIPAVDADLLEKIGENDPIFVEWLKELDTKPLLENALEKAIADVENSDMMNFSIDDSGYLNADADYVGDSEKAEIEKIIDSVSNQFQFELLKTVLELLDYTAILSKENADGFVLEGEKNEESTVHKYVRIDKAVDEESVLRFEHFESPQSLEKEKEEFLGLLQRLGIRIDISESQDNGQPIQDGTVHQYFLNEEEEEEEDG